MAKKLWGGRFKKELEPVIKCFSYSLAVDGELLEAEIRVTEAHAQMLARVGLLTAREGRRIVLALGQIGKKYAGRDPHRNPLAAHFKRAEDVHTFLQLELEKKVGAVAKKIHTGRSRNDLVVTSTLLYLKKKIAGIGKKITKVQKALVGFGERSRGSMIPGLTHLKWAQPVLLAHHLLAYVEMLERDLARLGEAAARMDRLPLGAGALAGSGLPIDPKFVARKLGFSKVAANSLDAVSDRDFVLETLADLSILWVHLSRLAEDFILWNSEPFGFVELDDSTATGSSLMPQKKNPDVFELVRGRAGVIFGHLVSLLTLLKGLPLAYNRDLQEDKPALFSALHKTALALEALSVTIERVELGAGIKEWAEREDYLYATDLLEVLVEKGTPFREAHEAVGRLVAYAVGQKKKLEELALSEFQRFLPGVGPEIYRLLDPWNSVKRKKTPGGTHPAEVQKCLAFWKKKLKKV